MSEHLNSNNQKGIALSISNSNPTNDPKKREEIQYTDKSYIALWDAKDQPVMDRLFHNRIRSLSDEFTRLRLKEMRLYLNNFTPSGMMKMPLQDVPGMIPIWEEKAAIHQTRWVIIESFEEILQRQFNDRTAHTPEPHETSYQEDMVLNYGMERFASLSCNESNTYFTHIASGSSLIPAGIGQLVLFDEKARVNIAESGWMTAKGRLIRGGAEFPKTIPDYDCTESAIMDSATAGGAAWRTVYPANKIVHQIQGSTYITISHTVDQGSVGL